MARPPQPRPTLVQPENESIRYIALTRGKIAVVDTCNYEKLNAVTWRADKRPKSQGVKFVARSDEGLMHRIILGITDPKIEVDHWNGDTLDNRTDNLRIATRGQNSMNVGAKSHSKTKIKGVEKTPFGTYTARIRANNKRYYLGTFGSPTAAAQAYNAAAIQHHGEFAKINTIT